MDKQIDFGEILSPLSVLLDNIKYQAEILQSVKFAISVVTHESISKQLKKHGMSAFTGRLTSLEKSGAEIISAMLNVLVKEQSHKYPFLYKQLTISLYTSLEAAMKDVVINYLQTEGAADIKKIGDIKISLFEYKNLTQDEKMDYLFEQYEKSLAAGVRYGINRFECLLKPIGLSGNVDDTTSDAIYELGQVRNNLLHKNGIVDKTLKDACPWLPFALRSNLEISEGMFDKYRKAVMRYITLLIDRCKTK